MGRSWVLLGIGVLISSQALRAEDAQLIGDAYFASGNNSNFGSTITVNVGGPTSFQGLLQFDLSTLPAGTTTAQISNATLRLYVSRIGTPGSINIYSASGAWSESTVNGTGFPTPFALVAPAVPVTTPNAYIVVDVTDQVKSWVAGTP